MLLVGLDQGSGGRLWFFWGLEKTNKAHSVCLKPPDPPTPPTTSPLLLLPGELFPPPNTLAAPLCLFSCCFFFVSLRVYRAEDN